MTQEIPETRALLALEEWLAADPTRSVAALARVIEIVPPAIFQWRTRRSRPDYPTRTRVRIAIGIPEEHWLTDEEREEEARRLARVAAAATQLGGQG